MKLKINKQKLEQLLSTAISNSGPLPILGYIHLKAEKDDMTGYLIGMTTDLEKTVVYRAVGAEVEREGSACVPLTVLKQLVPLLPDGFIAMDVDQQDGPMKLSCENSTYHINTRDVDEFPYVPKLIFGEEVVFDKEGLRNALKQAIIATADKNEQRAALTGVYFEIEKSDLRMSSTDGRRLVSVFLRAVDDAAMITEKVIVPKSSVKAVISALSVGGNIKMAISEDGGHIRFDDGHLTMYSRTISGQFPNYRVAIPNNSNTNAVVDRDQLLAAVKRVLITAIDRDVPDFLKMTFTDDDITLETNSVDIGNGVERLEVNYLQGDSLTVALNGRYLLDLLGVVTEEQIKIELINNERPIRFATDNRDNVYVIMPVRIRKREEDLTTVNDGWEARAA